MSSSTDWYEDEFYDDDDIMEVYMEEEGWLVEEEKPTLIHDDVAPVMETKPSFSYKAALMTRVPPPSAGPAVDEEKKKEYNTETSTLHQSSTLSKAEAEVLSTFPLKTKSFKVITISKPLPPLQSIFHDDEDELSAEEYYERKSYGGKSHVASIMLRPDEAKRKALICGKKNLQRGYAK